LRNEVFAEEWKTGFLGERNGEWGKLEGFDIVVG
jgi:hypothetical protein